MGLWPYEQSEILRGHFEDFEILQNCKNYELQGFFQRFEYYKDFKEDIVSWLKIDKNFKKPDEDDLVVHVRGGDLYTWHRSDPVHPQAVPVSVNGYIQMIKNIKYNKIFFVTEFEGDAIANELKKIFNGEIVSQSVIEDYYFIHKAKKIVLSPSSLPWWAAWLSDAQEIHFPMIGFWHPKSERNDMNTIVTNEERYKYYDFGVNDKWTGSKKELEMLLKY